MGIWRFEKETIFLNFLKTLISLQEKAIFGEEFEEEKQINLIIFFLIYTSILSNHCFTCYYDFD